MKHKLYKTIKKINTKNKLSHQYNNIKCKKKIYKTIKKINTKKELSHEYK